jgi:hypothetical protein
MRPRNALTRTMMSDGAVSRPCFLKTNHPLPAVNMGSWSVLFSTDSMAPVLVVV